MALRGQEQDHTSPESPSAVGGGGAHARSHGHHHNHHGGNARQKAVDEAELKQTHQALSVLLSDATAFDAAVDGIFRCMDTSADDEVDAEELMAYVQEASAGLGLPRPQPGQVQGVFRQVKALKGAGATGVCAGERGEEQSARRAPTTPHAHAHALPPGAFSPASPALPPFPPAPACHSWTSTATRAYRGTNWRSSCATFSSSKSSSWPQEAQPSDRTVLLINQVLRHG